MSLDPAVVTAMQSFITDAHLEGQALLIGGQALRDWGARLRHVLEASRPPLTPPALRATSDIDVHLALGPEDDTALAATLRAAWNPDPSKIFRFHWQHNAAVTLDLVTTLPTKDVKTTKRVKTLVKIGTSGHDIGAVRVFPHWVMDIPLMEPCHTPAFALLGINRLSHLGLLASKVVAINNVVDAHVQAGRPGGSLPQWVLDENRIDKDLGDVDTLLNRAWVDHLWSPLTKAQRLLAEKHLGEVVATFRSLRGCPTSLSPTSFQMIQRIAPALDRIMPFRSPLAGLLPPPAQPPPRHRLPNRSRQ